MEALTAVKSNVIKDKFNIFTILSKDDKELVHSGVIEFLIKESHLFCRVFLKEEHDNIKRVQSEGGEKGARFDLKIECNSNKVIFIENKFKSFPNLNQLIKYEEHFRKYYTNTEIVQILLCFNSNVVHFTIPNWKIISYNELLETVKEIISKESFDDEKTLFIRHYMIFLQQYCEKYDQLLSNCIHPFKNPNENINKFWLRVIYSEIIKAAFFNDTQVEYHIAGTKIPLLNVSYKRWIVNGYQHLIQLQGSTLKFYFHGNDSQHVTRICEVIKSDWKGTIGKVKVPDKRKSASCYLYQESILQKYPKALTVTQIIDSINDFIHQIDNVLNQFQKSNNATVI